MSVKTQIICTPNPQVEAEITALFCAEAEKPPQEGRNPLDDTKFNRLLGQISQLAFEEGMRYKKRKKSSYVSIYKGNYKKTHDEIQNLGQEQEVVR